MTAVLESQAERIEAMRDKLRSVVAEVNVSGTLKHPVSLVFGAGNPDEDRWIVERRRDGFLVERGLLSWHKDFFTFQLAIHRRSERLRLSSIFRYSGMRHIFPARKVRDLYGLLTSIPCGIKPALSPWISDAGAPGIILDGLQTELDLRQLTGESFARTLRKLQSATDAAFYPDDFDRWFRDVSRLADPRNV